jgi:hypothetical protein
VELPTLPPTSTDPQKLRPGPSAGSASAAAALGEAVPGYEILEELGRGGMGVVCKARHLVLNRLVALKFINKDRFHDPEAVRRFHREAQMAARLSHANIVAVYDAGQCGQTNYLALEYIEGESLASVVAREGPLPVAQACDYARQAADALQHAFEQGLVHRDVKPQNLMRTREGHIVKVLDFGLGRWASEVEAAEPLTGSNVLMGTPDYLAPEQARDARRADIRADIYSLGCTLYHLLAGRPPFHASSGLGKVAAHFQDTAPPVSQVRKDVPARLVGILERMMAKDPARRYQTPVEVSRALAEVAHRPAEARRHPPVSFLLLGGALAASALVALVFIARRPEPIVPPHTASAASTAPAAPISAREVHCCIGHENVVWGAAFAPDGKTILSASGEGWGRKYKLPPGTDCGLRLWDAETGRHVRHFPMVGGSALCVAFSPDGRLAMAGCADGTVRLWEIAGGKQVGCYRLHTDRVHGVDFCRDGKSAISASYDNTLLLWEVQTGKQLKSFEGHIGAITHVTISADGLRAASGSGDQTVRLWDMATAKEVQKFKADTQYVTCVALSPDGQFALSSGDSIQLWDLHTGAEVRRFVGQDGCVWRIVFSPDSTRALSGDTTGSSMNNGPVMRLGVGPAGPSPG